MLKQNNQVDEKIKEEEEQQEDKNNNKEEVEKNNKEEEAKNNKVEDDKNNDNKEEVDKNNKEEKDINNKEEKDINNNKEEKEENNKEDDNNYKNEEEEERKRIKEEEKKKRKEKEVKILKEEIINKINKPKDSKQIFKCLKNKIKDYNKDIKENENEIINIFEERNLKFNQNKNLNKCIYFNNREKFKLFNKNNYSNKDFSCVCSFCQNKINQKIIKFEEVNKDNSDYKLCNNCCNKIIKRIKNNKIEEFIINNYDNNNINQTTILNENIDVEWGDLYLVKNNEHIRIDKKIKELKLINLNYEMIKAELMEVKIEFQIDSINIKNLKFMFTGVTYKINGPDDNNNCYVILKIYNLNKKFPGLYIYSGFIKDSNNNQSSKYMFSIKIE